MALVAADPAVLSGHLGLLAITMAGVDSVVADTVNLLAALAERAASNVSARCDEHARAEQAVLSAQQAVRAADEAVARARSVLAQAQSALAQAQDQPAGSGSGSGQGGGAAGHPVDVSGHAVAVAHAQDALNNASRELELAAAQLADARHEEQWAQRRRDTAIALRGRVEQEVGRVQLAVAGAAVLQDLAAGACFLLTHRIDLLNEYRAELPALVASVMAGAAGFGGGG